MLSILVEVTFTTELDLT